MTSGLIFLASFVVVFALGIQQLNVNANQYRAAFITSAVICAATLVQFKVLPGPTSWHDVAGYIFGSAFGIVTSMWCYPRWFARKAAAAEPAGMAGSAVLAGDVVRLAVSIADTCARSDIESFCLREEENGLDWWEVPSSTDEFERQAATTAADYLVKRNRAAPHPTRRGLVRLLA